MEGEHLSWRHALAFIITVIASVLIWNGTHLVLTEPDRIPSAHLMHVSLAQPPAPPAPPKQIPKPPKPVASKLPVRRAPIVESAHPIGPPVAMDAPVAAQNSIPSPPAPPAPPAAPSGNVSLESTYIASFHAAVEEQKRYPMSKDARLQQPSGTTTLLVTLNRSGELLDATIVQSAGGILDHAALESIHRASFPPFPASIWPSQSQHSIKIDLYFHPQ